MRMNDNDGVGGSETKFFPKTWFLNHRFNHVIFFQLRLRQYSSHKEFH